MVYCVCGNCDSTNLSLSNNEKYLICNDCQNKEYIRDLEIGFGENDKNEEKIKEKKIELEKNIMNLLVFKLNTDCCEKCYDKNCKNCRIHWGLNISSFEEVTKQIVNLIYD